MPLSPAQFRALKWRESFRADDTAPPFVVFTNAAHPQITVRHERGPRRTLIWYCYAGRQTDSPSQLLKWYNDAEKQRLSSRHQAPGSPKQAPAREA